MNHNSTRRTISAVAMVSVATLVFLTTGIGSAYAVAGESSNASSRYLSGALFANVLPAVVDLSGSSATSNGTGANDVEQNNLNLTALSALTVTAPGGLQVPLHIADAGVLGQYAAANTNGSSLAATGLVGNNGTIGVANVTPGSVPGPLTFDLSTAVGNSGLGTALTNEVGNLSLDVGALSSRASLDGPPSQRSYEITNLGLNFHSAAVGSLVGRLNTQIATLQGTANGLSAGLKVALGGPLATVNVSTTNLASVVAADLTGTRTANGVTIDLATGNVTVDLSNFANLNGLAPNTDVLTPAEITAIANAITSLVTSTVTKVGTDLQTALNAITVQATIAAPVTGTQLVTINTTVGAILAGSTSGITILGGTFTLAGVLALLTPVVAPLGGVTASLVTAVAVPVNALVTPAVTQVIGVVLHLTANVQSSSGGADSVTALRLGLLTGLTRATTADLATSIVGPNVQIPNPTITGIAPTHGTEAGGTSVTLTGTGLDTVTSVTIGGATVTPTTQSTTSLTFVTPPHAAGAVTVTANAPQGNSGTQPYTYDAVASATSSLAPNTGPDTGGTDVTITGTGFIGATGVTFGGVAGTGFTVLSPTQLLVTSPAHAAGTVSVVVQDPAGNSAPRNFIYTTSPTGATSLTPATGPEEGGQTVTITGTNLTDATGVTFDGVAGTAFTHIDATHASIVTPAHAPGIVPVVVTNPAGDGTGLTYQYVASAAAATDIAPATGPESGGTTVTITGTGFTGATGVTFGGVAATGVVVVSPTTITAVTPAHAAGAVNVVVQDPAGNSAPLTYTYTAVASATTSLAPNTGPDTGGTDVTITGTGFLGATGVTFGGTPGTGFTVVSPTTITVTAPAHLAGSVGVVVQDPAGNSIALPFLYTPTASTEVSLTPTSGPQEGDTLVTITGTNMNDATGVTFGGVAGTLFTVVDATHATVRTPAHALGTVPVVLVNPAGNGTGLTFTFTATPSDAGSITPNTGPETGGTPVTILGSGFTGATGVTFDGVAATAVVVVDGNTITAIAPPHAAGAVDVVVQDPAGDSDPLTYTYTGVPSLALSLLPASGTDAGGTTVTITGTGFLGATGVTFDGVAGTAFTIVSPTRITVHTPAHPAGLVDVVVQDPAGDSLPLGYTFLPVASTASSLTPTHGTQAGGTTVTITGTGLADATGVRFGATLGTDYTVVDATHATVVTPQHGVGPVSVVVVNPAGNSAALSYTFDPEAADATSLSPTTGPETGGTTITITGTGFLGATGVTIDGTPASGFTVVNDTTITVTTPAHAAGDVDVVVTDPTGDSDPLTFSYTASAADAASLSPTSGTVAGNTLVTIRGTGFLNATGVTFDGTSGTDVTVVNSTTITVRTPEHVATGPVDVVVQDPAGDSDPLTYTYTAAAAHLLSLSPLSGPQAGGTTVTITGTGLLGSTGATFGLAAGTDYTVVNDTTATVVTPPHAIGLVAVTVQDPAGNGTGLGFTFVNAPSVVSGIDPTSGTQDGGTLVTITGSGFLGATAVRFAGTNGTSFTVVNDTTITVRTPAHAPGDVNVVVVDAAGNSAPQTYTYLGVASAATTISPASGPENGGTQVTITGTGFTGAAGVTFDGTPATDVTVVNDTTITATTPAGTPGTAVVIVQDPAGDSDPIDFIYTAGATITSVSPGLVPEAGGTPITIDGTCFSGATAVMFGDVTVTDFTVNPAGTQITVTAPPGQGVVDVTVVGSATCGTAVLPAAVSYVAAASVAELLTPGRGPETGHTLVTITGHGFTGATGVTFDGLPGTSFTVVDDEAITVRTPVHDPGDVDVIVIDPEANSPTLLFTYTPVSNGNGSAPGFGSGDGDGTSTAGGPLAFTGVDGTETAVAAIILLLSGVVLVLIWWRRRKTDSIR